FEKGIRFGADQSGGVVPPFHGRVLLAGCPGGTRQKDHRGRPRVTSADSIQLALGAFDIAISREAANEFGEHPFARIAIEFVEMRHDVVEFVAFNPAITNVVPESGNDVLRRFGVRTSFGGPNQSLLHPPVILPSELSMS